MNFFKGYRTVIFNVATIVASLAEVVGVVDVLAPGASAGVLLAVGIANLILRYLTTTAIGDNV